MRVALPARAHDRARQPLRQQRAVGQAGQGVVVGEVAQFLLGALLVGDVAEHGDVSGCAGRCASRTALHSSQHRNSSPSLRCCHISPDQRPLRSQVARACGGRSSGSCWRAVEQAGVAADHFDVAVAGHAGERGVDRDEVEIAVEHRRPPRPCCAALRWRCGARARRWRLAVMSRAVPAMRSARPVGVALDHAAARAHPDPVAVGAADAVFGQEQRRRRRAGAGAAGRAPRQVVGMDLVVGLDSVCTSMSGALRRRSSTRMRCSSPRSQVVVPELFARCPQRQLQAFLAFADLVEIAALAAPALAPAPATAPRSRASSEQRIRRERQRMPPQRRRRRARAGAVPAGSRRRRGWWPARGTCSARRQARVGDFAAGCRCRSSRGRSRRCGSGSGCGVPSVVERADAQAQQAGRFGQFEPAVLPRSRVRRRRVARRSAPTAGAAAAASALSTMRARIEQVEAAARRRTRGGRRPASRPRRR